MGGLSLVAVRGIVFIAASGRLIAVPSPCKAQARGARASVVASCRLSSFGAFVFLIYPSTVYLFKYE